MPTDFSKKRVAVLGAGKMGGILLKALLEKRLLSTKTTVATVQHEDKARILSKKLGIAVGTDNRLAVRNADIIVICVKPQIVDHVVEQIRAGVTKNQIVISVAASVPTSRIERVLKRAVPVIRAMPNTPCVVGCGMTALCKGKFATAEHLEVASALFGVVGRTVVVDEKLMDAVTGLSASGPAYIYIILESLAGAGVRVGSPCDVGPRLAAKSTRRAGRVLIGRVEAAALQKDVVNTQAG